MKRALRIIVLFATTSGYAVPGWLIGFGVGVGVQVVPFTRNHIIMPPLKAIQRTIRPIPQDKVDAANRKAEKARRKAAKRRHEQP
jgi:hypothetical protein